MAGTGSPTAKGRNIPAAPGLGAFVPIAGRCPFESCREGMDLILPAMEQLTFESVRFSQRMTRATRSRVCTACPVLAERFNRSLLEKRRLVMIIDFRVRPPITSNVKQQTFSSMFSKNYVENVWTRYREPIPSWDDMSVEKMVEEMDAAGVDACVLMGRVAEKGLDASCSPNEEIAGLLSHYPGRFYGFAGIEPRDAQAVEQIRFWVEERGFRGIALDPGWSTPPLYADAPEIEPVYAYCEEHGIIVSVTQSGLMGPDMSYADPRRIQRVASSHPGLVMVLPHACWPYFHDALFVAMACSNVYLIPDTYLYTKGMPMVGDFVLATNYHVKKQVLFASSYPLGGFEQCIDAWKKSGFSDEALELTLGGNAARLLGI